MKIKEIKKLSNDELSNKINSSKKVSQIKKDIARFFTTLNKKKEKWLKRY